MKVRYVTFAAVLMLVTPGARGQDTFAQQTVVIYNSAISESLALAEFYAKKRGIASDHILGN